MKKVTTVEQLEAHYQDDQVTLYHGDCLEVMASLPAESVDAICTDPPYGLGFMGKKWDDLPPGLDFAVEAMRVLKPGGHLLAFGGTRTWHRLAVAIEDAGFEIRDSIAWLYGSGFPKSLDVSKVIDKAAGVEFTARPAEGVGFMRADGRDGYNVTKNRLDRAGETTPDAERWQGWGTALKPAFEPIIVARKPLTGTVAANVLEHGTGALNIDACRIGTTGGRTVHTRSAGKDRDRWEGNEWTGEVTDNGGRWPANVILDESQAAELDRQSGVLKSGVGRIGAGKGTAENASSYESTGIISSSYGDTGGASRFFKVVSEHAASTPDFPTFRYQAKAPTRERPRVNGVAHPTVKPLDLMRWLVRLVTPPGGTVLDPFAGSGTTGEACLLEHLNCILIEREEDYLPLIVQRVIRTQHTADTTPGRNDDE